jgi:3-dehydroquinate synthetase
MARDKKRQHDQIHFVLLKEIGKTSVEAELDESVFATSGRASQAASSQD